MSRSRYNGIKRWGSLTTGNKLALLVCGGLILASFFLPDPRSRRALPFSPDLRIFFSPIDWRFSWLYFLMAATGAYAVSLSINLAQSLRRLPRSRRQLGILLCHVSFLAAIGAHLCAGFLSRPVRHILIPPAAMADTIGLSYVDFATAYNDDGSARSFSARIAWDGQRLNAGVNRPLWIDWRTFLLVDGIGQGYALAVSDAAGTRNWLTRGGTERYLLERVSHHPSLRRPMALVLDKTTGSRSWYAAGMTLPGGETIMDIQGYRGIKARILDDPGAAGMIVAALLFLAGMLLTFPVATNRRN